MSKVARLTSIILGLILCCGALVWGALYWHSEHMLNYRTSQSESHQKKIKKNAERALNINRKGLDNLNISGSGIPNIDYLARYQQKLGTPLTVVSLMSYDQLYLTDFPLDYYCLELVHRKFIEHRKPSSMVKELKCRLRRLVHGIPQEDRESWMRLAQTEEQRLKMHGINYVRLIYTSHQQPRGQRLGWESDWSWVDEFIEFMEKTPQGTPVHFHCEHGCGRTTACMVMYDIFHNWRDVSLQDINNRHWALGGEDLIKCKWRPEGTWTKAQLDARKDLIIKFDAYMRDMQQGYGKHKFSDWLKTQSENK